MHATVYTQPNCSPCIAMKRYLDKYGLEYDEVNVREDADAFALVRALGFTSTPVLVFRDDEGEIFSAHDSLSGEVARLVKEMTR